MRPKRIAIFTGGGDCSGLNAVIRAVAKKAMGEGYEVIGIEDGYEGLVKNKYRKLENSDVSGILALGGTILGTSNTANPYRYAVQAKDCKFVFKDYSKTAIRNFKRLKADALVAIGGDGTLSTAYRLYEDGIPIVGVPKTIDNDILGTDITFGFDTAVWVATEGIDRIHTTAQSHHRVMIVEVMGRTAGWIALHSGVAGGGDIILIPEIPYDINSVVKKIKERHGKGKRFSIIVISEGAKPKGGDVVVKRMVRESFESIRLGGVSFVLGAQIEKMSCIETRAVVMGHLQRGGSPTPFDRVLATQLGTRAMDFVNEGAFGHMVAVRNNEFVKVTLRDVAKGKRLVPRNHPLVESARSVGTSFGE
ncbi:MAG: 6-phosphofructokinase [Omnitrophica WOR_2 bacterium RIFCSPLOWO2_12_FULL_51_24]|nr:MAG: 6-phosphofructokinase [Omnitrophica WOR_2 bacterium RIFCSPHIGHO2_01_FULL_49_10]OGX32962.1 MAG: 6-phosphofructokinase [Omnitrophica WOR_2 bacterium RIFCSPLOWO2_02_FULL_50_19]OGX42421.1 MAG: 6-phosphofructokinase [Omnitrophica WOR_2 bacterium RIFCSPLOWO2_12_FULL_51_24]